MITEKQRRDSIRKNRRQTFQIIMDLFTLLTGSRWRPLIFTGAVIIAKVPKSVMKPAMALPYHLYMLLTQGTSSENAYGTAFVMMVVLVTNSLAIWFTRRNRK